MMSQYLSDVLSKDIPEKYKLKYKIVWYSAICHELYLKFRELEKRRVLEKPDDFLKSIISYKKFKTSQLDVRCLEDNIDTIEEFNYFCLDVENLALSMMESFIPVICYNKKNTKKVEMFVLFEADSRLKDFIIYEKISHVVESIVIKFNKIFRKRL